MLPDYPRITGVEVRAHFVVGLTFADGSRGVVDLAPSMRGHGGMFAPLQDPDYFAQVRVDPESGTIVWPNGVDLDPDVLYHKAHFPGDPILIEEP